MSTGLSFVSAEHFITYWGGGGAMRAILLLAAMGALPTPEELLNQLLSANQRINTYECEFKIIQEQAAAGAVPVIKYYKGLHRFSAPSTYYFEWQPCDIGGTPLQAEKQWFAGSDEQHTAMNESPSGSQEVTTVPGPDYALPIGIGTFVPRFLYAEALFSAKQQAVAAKDGELILKVSSDDATMQRDFVIDPRKQFSVTAIDYFHTIGKLGRYHVPTTFTIVQSASGDWVCTGGSQQQINPDGLIQRKTTCEIPLTSIRVNQPIAATALILPIGNGARVFDPVQKRVFTTGTRSNLDTRLSQQLAELAEQRRSDPQLSAKSPIPVGISTRPSWWQRYVVTIAMLGLAGAFCIAAIVLRARRGT